MSKKITPFHDRRIVQADIAQYDLSIREFPRNAPSVGIFDLPVRCYMVNEEWDAHISGAISALTEWRAWVGDDDERNLAVQEVLKLFSEDNCMLFQLRQNTNDPCLMEQSFDGGVTWSTAFDYSICVSPALQNQSLNDSIDLLNQLLADYDTTVASIAPNMVYDSTPDDITRDDALCHALNELVDLMCEAELEYRRQIALAANVTAIMLALLGVVISIATAGTATPFYLAVSASIAGGFGTVFGGLSTLILNDQVARDEVACCMRTALFGSTLTQIDFEESLDNCGFVGGTNEAQLSGAIVELLTQDDMYTSFLDYMERAYRLAELGITDCPCVDVWQETFDFTTGQLGWSVVASRGSYVAGVGFRSFKFSGAETGNYFFYDNLPLNTVTSVEMSGTFTGDSSVTFRSATLLTYDDLQNLSVAQQYTPPNSPTQFAFNGSFVNYGLRAQVYMTGFNGGDPIITISSMTVKGTGVNPF